MELVHIHIPQVEEVICGISIKLMVRFNTRCDFFFFFFSFPQYNSLLTNFISLLTFVNFIRINSDRADSLMSIHHFFLPCYMVDSTSVFMLDQPSNTPSAYQCYKNISRGMPRGSSISKKKMYQSVKNRRSPGLP